MTQPARLQPPVASPPAVLEFARALARAHVARDLAKPVPSGHNPEGHTGGDPGRHAHADLRPL